MSGKRLSLGIAGTSWWADAMYLPALASYPQARLAAICGRNQENAQRMAARWGIPEVFTDYRDMLASAALDALIVATPNDSHYPITVAALQQGLHVLCEKPIALNYSQAQEMARLAQSHGLKSLVPFTYSYMPTARYLKQLLDEGYIGQPYHMNLRYYTGYARAGDYRWRFDQRIAGAGVVGDLGSHFLYLAEHFFGEIVALSCRLGYTVPRPKLDPQGSPYPLGDDSCMLSLEFANGALGSIHCSAVCYEDSPFGQSHHMEFHGAGGTLYSNTDWDTVQVVKGARVGDGMVRELPIPDHIWGSARRDTVHNTYRDIFRAEDFMLRGFLNAIRQNRESVPNLAHGARIQRLISAALHSHDTGQHVRISSILD